MAGTVRDLLLLGAGMAHLELLRRLARRPVPRLRLTLVAPYPERPHDALLPALLRGERSPAEACIDLGMLGVAAGARLILAEPVALSLNERKLLLAERPPLRFDLLSLDLDSDSAVLPGEGVIPLQPLGGFMGRLAGLEATLPEAACVAVIGDDPISLELALALAQRWAGRFRVALVGGTAEPLALAPQRARRAVRAALVEAGVALVSGVEALALDAGRLALSDGTFLAVDAAICTRSSLAPRMLAESGLACDAAGRALVDVAQRCTSHPFVFAVGDAAAATPGPMRAGWVLATALRRAARDRTSTLLAWPSLPAPPALLDLGPQHGVAWYEGLALTGHLMARGRRYIDRRRIARFAQRPARRQMARALSAPPRATVLDAAGTAEQMAVLTPPSGQGLVQNVACLRCGWLDDPFAFGQIAAAHALAGVHAAGARPWTALPIIALSGAHARSGELADMLAGAAAVLDADGCAVLPGHNGAATETSVGFAVTGLTDPVRLPRRTRLRPGDALVLTKPLGSGILLAGQAAGAVRAAWLEAAIAVMRTSNAAASRILRLHNAGACTAVNGLGLAGHLEQMLHVADAAATLWPEALPVMPGAMELLAPHGYAALLADPQVSGGLLAGVPAARAEACVAALHAAGLPGAIVGTVEAAEPDAPAIRVALS